VKKLDSIRTPLYDRPRASLRSDNSPNIPECCPLWIGNRCPLSSESAEILNASQIHAVSGRARVHFEMSIWYFSMSFASMVLGSFPSGTDPGHVKPVAVSDVGNGQLLNEPLNARCFAAIHAMSPSH